MLALLGAGLIGAAPPVVAAPVVALPDLISVIPTSDLGVTHPTPTTKEFDYTHIVYNAGAGPLEVQPTNYDTTTQFASGVQRVYAYDGTTQSLAQTIPIRDQFYFHTLHGHFHFPLASFGLYSVKADGSVGDPVALSPKNGFCIGDSVQLDPTLAHSPPWVQYAGDTCINPTAVRGISPGWGDLYNRDDPGQSIDITNLPDGVYWFHTMADPGHNFVESDSTNNTTDIKLRITGDTVTPLSPLVSQGKFVIDQSFLDDGVGPASTPTFSTTSPNDLLVAYVSADGAPSTPQTATVSGGGLTWSLAQRTNTQRGTSEVWTAKASGLLSGAVIRSTTSTANMAQSLSVFAIAGASGIGAKGSANAANGAPGVALTTTSPGSWVMGVGNDPDRGVQRIPPTGQTMVHEWWGTASSWLQATTGPTAAAGTAVNIHDDYPKGNAWNMSAVEILAADTNDTTAPAITAAHTTRVGPDTAAIAWTTDEPASSQVAYGPTAALGQTTPVDPTLVTAHETPLSGLTPSTSYFCELRSTDPAGNTGVSAFNFTTTAPRTTPPVFTNIGVSDLQPDQATFAWTTDEPADSQVEYGTTNAYGSASTRDPNPTTAHFTLVNGLTPATTYHYRVRGTDAYGNAGVGPDGTFTTPAVPPPITIDTTVARDAKGVATTPAFATSAPKELLVAFVAADGPGGGGQTSTVTGAGLTWTLARRANGRPGTSEVWTATAPTALTNATVTSTASSGGFDQSLTVVAFAGAVGIGGGASSSPATGAPSVSFSTTRPGSFAYGVGNDWDRATARTVGTNQTIAHQWVDTAVGDTFWTQSRTGAVGPVETVVTLNDTAPTADQFNFVGVEIVRPVSIPVPIPDTTPPVISALGASGLTTTGATVAWTTDEASTTQVDYGTTTAYGASSPAGTTLATAHGVTLAGLAPSTTYHARARSTDASGNTAVSNDITFTTLTPPPPDTTPPVITAFAASGVTTTGATFTWTTDEPATTQVDLGTTVAYGSTSPLVSTLTTSHAVTLTNLVASTAYHVRARSTDASGNLGTSSDLVVTTLAPPPPSALAIDTTSNRTGTGAVTTNPLSTTAPTLLLAFVSSDGPTSGGQTATVSGAGLTWTLVRRTNTRPGSSEVWRATAPAVLTNATVTSTPSRTGFDQSLTVVAFRGASGIGASAGANAATGAPTVSLTTTKAGSWVFAVGNDWDRAVTRTVGTGQSLVSQWVDTAAGDTFWVQSRTAVTPTLGTAVTLNDTAPTNDRWNLTAVEVLPN